MNTDGSHATPLIDAREISFIPLLVTLILAPTLFPLSAYLPVIFTVVVSLSLLSGMRAVMKFPGFRISAGIVLCVGLPLRWAAHLWGNEYPWLTLASHAVVGLYFVILEIFVISQVIAHPRITSQTLLGAVCGYLLIGVIFTFAFAVLTHFDPGAIQVNGKPIGHEMQTAIESHVAELIYFSFITLSTVGYGDIVPVCPFARSLVVLEALSGQIYLAAFVARLVGLMSLPSNDSKAG